MDRFWTNHLNTHHAKTLHPLIYLDCSVFRLFITS
nr:MAG TPA: hypothetical protein [Caudoviricetes sp.]